MVAAGIKKLVAGASDDVHFAAIGLPLWFVPVTGWVEVIAGLLTAWPRTRPFGASVVAGTMAGAAVAEVVGGFYARLLLPLGLLALACYLMWRQRDVLLALLPRR